MENQIEIPQEVIDALKEVRDEGNVNMMNRIGVIREAMRLDWNSAAIWMNDNKRLYVEALQAMGRDLSQNGSEK